MIPVTILTGFLGSGKTTLLTALLRDPRFGRTAVLMNEFGEIGLDHEIVESCAETLMRLTTGCLCCRIETDLARTMAGLETRRQRGEIEFDRVMVETSGLADPAPIAHAFMTDSYLAAHYVVDKVITTVDAVHGAATLTRYPEARRQLALADLVVMTKTDLAPDAPHALRSALASLNQDALVLEARCGAIDAAAIFAPRDFNAEIGGDFASAPHREASAEIHCSHSHGYSSISVVRDAALLANTVALFLEGLATHAGPKLLRLKGVVCVAEAPERPLIVNSVQQVFYQPYRLEKWPSRDHRSRFTLIVEDVPGLWPDLLLSAIEQEVTAISCGRSARLAAGDRTLAPSWAAPG